MDRNNSERKQTRPPEYGYGGADGQFGLVISHGIDRASARAEQI